SAEAADAIRDVEQCGAACIVQRGDVAVKRDVDAAVARFGVSLPKLAGVVHAAGTLADATIVSITPDQLQGVLSSKVEGAWHLHQAVGDHALDFFVMMSSLSSVLASAGQASYAGANAFLDRLAHHRHALGLPALAINWGPW